MKLHFLIIASVLCLVGCGVQSPELAPSDQPKPQGSPSVISTLPPITQTPVPTASWTPTRTIPASPTPRITPPPLELGILSEGTILFDPEGQGIGVHAVIEKYRGAEIPPEAFLTIQNCCLHLNQGTTMLSLSHQYASIIRFLAESDVLRTDLIVTDGDKQITTHLEKLQARDVAYWLNDTEVFLYPTEDPYPYGDLILYNPFTQQSRVISPTFPNLIDRVLYRVPSWDTAPDTPKYDPSLSRVVYYEMNFYEPDWAISLWDLETNTEIWRRNLKSMAARPWSSEPQWSPDGSRFAIFLPDAIQHKTLELTLVDRDGKETVLLDPAVSKKITWGSGISWSPDGQYLSFYVQEEQGVRLLVYDFEQGQLWDPSIVEVTKNEMAGNPGGVIWSPDSKQFLAHNFLPEPKDFSYLIDVEKRQIYDFGHPFWAAVWLAPVK